MNTRQYESVVIINAALEDHQIDETINRIKETISTQGAEIFDIENWGRKRLAYPIQKAKSGFYSIFRFSAQTNAIVKIERMYRLDEDIFRYLTVCLTKEDLDFIEKQKTEAENREEIIEDSQKPEDSNASEETIKTPEDDAVEESSEDLKN